MKSSVQSTATLQTLFKIHYSQRTQALSYFNHHLTRTANTISKYSRCRRTSNWISRRFDETIAMIYSESSLSSWSINDNPYTNRTWTHTLGTYRYVTVAYYRSFRIILLDICVYMYNIDNKLLGDGLPTAQVAVSEGQQGMCGNTVTDRAGVHVGCTWMCTRLPERCRPVCTENEEWDTSRSAPLLRKTSNGYTVITERYYFFYGAQELLFLSLSFLLEVKKRVKWKHAVNRDDSGLLFLFFVVVFAVCVYISLPPSLFFFWFFFVPVSEQHNQSKHYNHAPQSARRLPIIIKVLGQSLFTCR